MRGAVVNSFSCFNLRTACEFGLLRRLCFQLILSLKCSNMKMSPPRRIAGRAEEWCACCIQVQVLSRLSEMYESRPFLLGRWLRKKEAIQTVRTLRRHARSHLFPRSLKHFSSKVRTVRSINGGNEDFPFPLIKCPLSALPVPMCAIATHWQPSVRSS